MVENVTEVEVLGGVCRGKGQGLQRILEVVDEYEETIVSMIGFLFRHVARCEVKNEGFELWEANTGEYVS